MAAKKNTAHATPPKMHKVHQRKTAKIEDLPTEASAPAAIVLAEAAQTPANPAVAAEAAEAATDPMAEASRIVKPTPAEESATATADSSPEPTTPANQLSALDAAAKVLGETGQSMRCPELIAAMAAKGYWSSPTGRTPAGTLYSAILRELQTKGEQSRFVKTQRGKFALRGAV
jgi:HB1, ASXL, restriction endonuclease HTH domain